MSYITVTDLGKTFTVRKKREKGGPGREKTLVRALSQVSFQVEKGELVGCIGPNGAGKSTTVKILSGILVPDEGSATVDGRVPWKERREHVRRIGVVFGQRTQLWWDVPIIDSFRLLKEIYLVPGPAFEKRLSELTEALELGGLLRTPLRLMSLGQRMRAELCGSLLHSPELLFLDEPTIGLDAPSKLALRDFLRRENREKGTTILLTTHDMEDIAALCPRVMVLGHGRKLYDGALTGLLSRYDTLRIAHVRYADGARPPALPPDCALSREGDTWQILYHPAQTPTAGLLTLLQSAGAIQELTLQGQNVDHLIATMYEEMAL